MSFDVANKVALVTGANRGIGKVIVDRLIQEGAAKVYAAVRKLDSAEPLSKEHGSKIVPVAIDLSDSASIKACAEAARDVELVVSNAGVLQNASPLAENTIEALQFEMTVNVIGLLHMARYFAPVLKANGGGAFVQLNSVASVKAFPAFATYSASKAAAYSITQSLKTTLAEQGTQDVSVHPGPIDTATANDAGLGEQAEPPTVVADGIIAALKSGTFHVFPDSMAKQVGAAYEGFAKNIVEANLMEG